MPARSQPPGRPLRDAGAARHPLSRTHNSTPHRTNHLANLTPCQHAYPLSHTLPPPCTMSSSHPVPYASPPSTCVTYPSCFLSSRPPLDGLPLMAAATQLPNSALPPLFPCGLPPPSDASLNKPPSPCPSLLSVAYPASMAVLLSPAMPSVHACPHFRCIYFRLQPALRIVVVRRTSERA